MQDMLNGRFSKDRYCKFLIGLYPLVSHFCPLMASAAGLCADQYPNFRNYIYNHINEERDHELMVLEDIVSLGGDAKGVPERSPSLPVQAMLAFNYHAVRTENPCNILGLIYVLEVISADYGGKVAKAISESIDMPLSQGFTFLDSHAVLDEDHVETLDKLFQENISPELEVVILNSLKMNFYLFENILRELG